MPILKGGLTVVLFVAIVLTKFCSIFEIPLNENQHLSCIKSILVKKVSQKYLFFLPRASQIHFFMQFECWLRDYNMHPTIKRDFIIAHLNFPPIREGDYVGPYVRISASKGSTGGYNHLNWGGNGHPNPLRP